ncbi:MAG: hypothetical protein M3328_04275, partial [Chloroflexota bacterium]|nr:hypothetical protein [Chloroflexota bacterium]
MQVTPPLEVAEPPARRPVRRYVVVGLAGLLLLGATFAALLLSRTPALSGPQPSQSVVELAASYTLLQTLEQESVLPAWAPDGLGMATYSDKQVHLWELVGDRLSERGSLSVDQDDVQEMLWSPDGRTLAVYSKGAANMPSAPGSIAADASPWLPNQGYMTPTLTLIDPGTA